jgi:hypothetical protein
MKPNLGTTQYYETNTNGIKGYTAMPFAGNHPQGYTPIDQSAYVSGLQNKLSTQQGLKNAGLISGSYSGGDYTYNGTSGTKYQGELYDQGAYNKIQQQLTEAQGNTGQYAQGYIDPTFQKFNPQGPADFTNLNPQGQAQYNANQTGYNKAMQTGASGNYPGGSQQPFTEQLAKKYGTTLANLQGTGIQAPTTSGSASAAISGATPPNPPPGPNYSAINTALQGNQGMQDFMTQFNQLMSPQVQQQSLTQEYQTLMAQSGLPALNTQLMNMKNVIEGTEDDIRNEITKAGGFATDSQVMALSNARNKTLVKNYNGLLDQQKLLQDQVNTMIGLAKDDRQFAQQQMEQQMNIGIKLYEMQQSMQTKATDTMYNNIKAFGAKAVYDAALASGDPYAVQRINQTMGNGFDIASIAKSSELALKTSQEKDLADLALTKAQTANQYSQIAERNKTSTANTYGTLDNKPQSDTQSAANLYANRLSQANQIIDTVGTKFADVSTAGSRFLPTFLQSSERQQYEQAKKNFVTAVLRRESGAAISDSEFKTANEQYFPQPGDKPEVLANKTALRNGVINDFYKEANVAKPQSLKLLTPTEIPTGYYQASDGLLYKKS